MRGRGRNFTLGRRLIESTLGLLYANDWPARAWARVPGATSVQRLEHALPAAVRKPLRLGFASDLHLGPTTPLQTLENAFALLDDARLDVLLLGGDYVFLEATNARARTLAQLVRSVRAPVKLGVLGNHDLWTRHERLETALAEAGVKVLINDSVRLPPPHDDVAVIGLDDPWTGLRCPDGLDWAPDAAVRLVLCHAPDSLPLVRGRNIALYVCGHTHGGHLALPGPRPLYVPGTLGRRWPFGLHQAEGTPLFVSRGVGGVEVPMRLNAPPDVAVFDLRPGA